MTEPKEGKKFEHLVHKLEPHGTLLRTWELNGGVSAQVTTLEIERPDGRTKKMVVRRHGAVDRTHNPHIAADEFKLLRIVRSAGLAAPEPYFLDQSGEVFSTPYVVIEFIEGSTEISPADVRDSILQMATYLAKIHRVDGSLLDLTFLPKQAARLAETLDKGPATVDTSLDEGRIRDALESIWPWPQRNPDVLLHGDFWPGNVVWKDGRLVAVIDWEDGALGDPLADLANSRLEIRWAFGIDAMHTFTQHYISLTTVDCTDLPYLDLCAALRPAFKIAEWAGDDSTARRMRELHKWFVSQAFEKLPVP
ncbi:MAG: phosphotransferase family protein [Chloroflexota bacterium]